MLGVHFKIDSMQWYLVFETPLIFSIILYMTSNQESYHTSGCNTIITINIQLKANRNFVDFGEWF